ncbi:MAG: signal peptidase II [Verrucomicrobiota bacterium]
MMPNPDRRMLGIACGITVIDQLSKFLVLSYLGFADEKVIVPGFFKFVHWGNTGAAWSILRGNNELLSIISLLALMGLVIWRRHFDGNTVLGACGLGLLFGGIVGNVIDRIVHKHVIDFIYFYVQTRSGREVGFPAFNVADSAICIGVGLLFVLSFQREHAAPPPQPETEPKAE